MSPQPLSKVKPNAQFKSAPGDLAKHPDLCAMVLDTISVSSKIEYNWSIVIVELLRSDTKNGVAMYEALSGAESRRAAIMGAAASALSREDFCLLQAVAIALAPQRRIRNYFVHHTWAICDDIPDALLLIDPRCLRKFEVGIAMSDQAGSGPYRTGPEPKMDKSMIAVWRRRDIENARIAMYDALGVLWDLLEGLNMSSPGVAIEESSRRRLLHRPAIAQALRKLFPQKSPPKPQRRPQKRHPVQP